MWKLKIAEDGEYLISGNNFIGREHWEFDPNAGTEEERAEVERLRQKFTNNRFSIKQSSDLLMRLQLNDDFLGLIVFKSDLHDPSSSIASWKDDSSACSWNWVQCNPATGRVTEINLAGLGLSRKIGRGLEKLQHLMSQWLLWSNTNFISLKDAASFPEVSCTVWSTVFMMSRLLKGETFLIHGGSSGIGTFAIQIAKYRRARVFDYLSLQVD
ncbi:Lupeol synthase [Arachis hypogaea]|nr:Lupeol synthase [Arachis hypogaea]